MNEVAPVVAPVAAPVEAAPAAEPTAPIETAEPSGATFADLDAEYGLSEEFAPETPQAGQPDIYGKLTELEQRLAQIIPAATPELDVLEDETQGKVDVSKIEQNILAKIQQQQTEQAKNQQIVQGAIQESQAVKKDYELKILSSLEKGGVNLDEQPLLKDFLMDSLQSEIQKEQISKGRPILSGAEMKAVVSRHLQRIKPSLSRAMPTPASQPITKSLSTAGNAVPSMPVDKKSAYDNFKQKKGQGTLSMSDILKAL